MADRSRFASGFGAEAARGLSHVEGRCCRARNGKVGCGRRATLAHHGGAQRSQYADRCGCHPRCRVHLVFKVPSQGQQRARCSNALRPTSQLPSRLPRTPERSRGRVVLPLPHHRLVCPRARRGSHAYAEHPPGPPLVWRRLLRQLRHASGAHHPPRVRMRPRNRYVLCALAGLALYGDSQPVDDPRTPAPRSGARMVARLEVRAAVAVPPWPCRRGRVTVAVASRRRRPSIAHTTSAFAPTLASALTASALTASAPHRLCTSDRATNGSSATACGTPSPSTRRFACSRPSTTTISADQQRRALSATPSNSAGSQRQRWQWAWRWLGLALRRAYAAGSEICSFIYVSSYFLCI